MPHAYPRHVRFASSIQQIIAPQLLGLIPDALVTVTRVTVTPDLAEARIAFTVIGAREESVQDLLDGRKVALRRHLARNLGGKRVPKISFEADVTGRPGDVWADS